MNDRELLTLAAKAAGIRINHWVYEDYDLSPAMLEEGWTWNPRTDDGDAFRLAVKLRLPIKFDEIGEECGNDSLAEDAARRAIVRAAAEIGRNMK